jgi:hydrogenase-4 component F
MKYSFLFGLLLGAPLAGGALCVSLSAARKILNSMCAAVLASAAIVGYLAWKVFTQGPMLSPNGLFLIDALSAFHLCVMAIVFSASSLYAKCYFQRELESGKITRRALHQFSGLWCGALAAMSLVLISNNLGIMWVGIEATTLSTAFLICIPKKPTSLEAMWKYLMICSVGVAFAFLGTLMVAASATGLKLGLSEVLLWTRLQQGSALLNPMLLKMGFICLVVGYGTKAGLAPMHSWLPDAHSQAPAPVSAIFSGFMLSASLYCIMRYIPIIESATGNSGWGRQILLFLGVISIFVAAAFIIFQRNVKRMLAYSSVEHIGIIALSLGLGGFGSFVALFHTLNHSICKTLAFFAAGRLGQTYGSHQIAKMSGSLRAAPVWGSGLFCSILVLIGAAPFAIFMSEFQALKTALDAGSTFVFIIFLAGCGVVFVGALRYAIGMAWGDPSVIEEPEAARAIEKFLAFAPIFALLLLGLWMPDPLLNILKQASLILEARR